MKKLTKPKIIIPLIVALIALGALAATTMSGRGDASGNYGGSHGHEQ